MIPATSLKEFLKPYYLAKGNKSQFTHTRIPGITKEITGGCLNIPDDKMSDFWNIYYKHVFESNKTEHLTERQLRNGEGPILIDFDFRYSVDITERQHNDDFIDDIIALYLQELNKIKDFESIEECTFPIYIFQKPNVNILPDSDKTKDGIHMIIGIKSSNQEQWLLRENVKDGLKTIIEEHELPIVNTIDDVLDKGITRGDTNWQMYGSCKPENEAYKLINICTVKYENTSVNFEDNFELENNRNISDFNMKRNINKLSARYNNHISINTKENVLAKITQKENARSSRTKLKKTSKNALITNNKIKFEYITNKETLDELVEIWLQSNVDQHLKEVHKYTMALPSEFYTQYDKWLRVGCALVHTDEKMILTWIAFSAQWQKFSYDTIHNEDKDNIIKFWKSFAVCNDEKNNLSYKSIIFWLKNSDYPKYKEIYNNSLDYYIDESLKSGTEVDIAKLLFKLYSDRFVCINIQKNIWYEFSNHKWNEIDSGVELRKEIHDGLMEVFALKIQSLVAQCSELGNNSESQENDPVMKRVKTSIAKGIELTSYIKKTANKNNIMRECRDIFYDKHFMDKMDQNPYLLCFNNGVFDFKEQCFRDGSPEDYITKCTNTVYAPKDLILNYSVYEAEIIDFMNKLFPIEELREYMWDHLASTLIGVNYSQTVNIYTGSGSNGKSLLVDLMGKMLGDYKGTVPNQLITQKRSNIGQATPEIAQLFGVRYAVISEPSKGDTINEGILKEITGGDPLQGRLLYGNTITFIPQFKLAVCTNTLPNIPAQDAGTWRRIRLCPYMSKFTDNPIEDDPDEPYQFLKDDDLAQKKLPNWAQPFMTMLIERAIKTNGKVKDCQIVLNASDSYRADQDCIKEFIDSKIKKDDNGTIQKNTLNTVFKQWYQLEYGNRNTPKSKELYARFDKEFHKYNRCWRGISIIYENDDDETYDEIDN